MGRLIDFFKAFIGTEESSLDAIKLTKEEQKILEEMQREDKTEAIETRINEKYKAIVNTKKAQEVAANKIKKEKNDIAIRTNE